MLHAADSQELQILRIHNYTYAYNFVTVIYAFILVVYVHTGNSSGIQNKTPIFAGGKSVASLKTNRSASKSSV